MNIKDYLNKLNKKSQEIFSKTLEDDLENLAYINHVSSFLYEFSELLFDNSEEKILQTVAMQLETASMNLIYGMYRQAFSSLRLAFELSLGLVHFSIHKLELNEWLIGKNDIKWNKLIDEDNGILSKRFSNAFFPELSPIINNFNAKAKTIYRQLSEYVHGNNETWNRCGLNLDINIELKKEYFTIFKSVSEIVIFVLCCRYLKSITLEKNDSISDFLLEEFSHISMIREYLGGVEEI